MQRRTSDTENTLIVYEDAIGPCARDRVVEKPHKDRTNGPHPNQGLDHKVPVNGRVDRASATETVGSGSIPARSNQGLKKLVFIVFLLDVQQ